MHRLSLFDFLFMEDDGMFLKIRRWGWETDVLISGEQPVGYSGPLIPHTTDSQEAPRTAGEGKVTITTHLQMFENIN